MVTAHPELVTARLTFGATRRTAASMFLDDIRHYMYEGDTALHIAAAAYGRPLAARLVELGADVHAINRRKQTPLHYAVDGGPGSPTWDPRAQTQTVETLITAGADPNAGDAGGTTPLHRAVRNRCAAAVKLLLDRGADPRRKNHRGSTAADLAKLTTGRSGSGSPAAKAQQALIVGLLAARR